jgi:hypothetical protein
LSRGCTSRRHSPEVSWRRLSIPRFGDQSYEPPISNVCLPIGPSMRISYFDWRKIWHSGFTNFKPLSPKFLTSNLQVKRRKEASWRPEMWPWRCTCMTGNVPCPGPQPPCAFERNKREPFGVLQFAEFLSSQRFDEWEIKTLLWKEDTVAPSRPEGTHVPASLRRVSNWRRQCFFKFWVALSDFELDTLLDYEMTWGCWRTGRWGNYWDFRGRK